jgi:hypothetical protein
MARLVAAFMLALVGVIGATEPASAQIGSERYSSLVMEARTGRVISAVNPDELRHPASLTKMMTLYMVFEALRDRRIAGAGLDVFDTEPLPAGHPLTRLPTVVLTPHLGWPTDRKYEQFADAAADVLLAWLDGRDVPRFVEQH